MNSRRDFLSLAGKGLGLAALPYQPSARSLKEVEAATRNVAHLTPEQVAMDEDYWSVIQNSFTVTRGIVNLNNGGVSPSPRIVTEALVRYIWQQEDATAYTMWQTTRAAVGNYSHRFGGNVWLRSRRDRNHTQRIRIARDSSHGNGFQTRR